MRSNSRSSRVRTCALFVSKNDIACVQPRLACQQETVLHSGLVSHTRWRLRMPAGHACRSTPSSPLARRFHLEKLHPRFEFSRYARQTRGAALPCGTVQAAREVAKPEADAQRLLPAPSAAALHGVLTGKTALDTRFPSLGHRAGRGHEHLKRSRTAWST
jgi:hypothetical protein